MEHNPLSGPRRRLSPARDANPGRRSCAAYSPLKTPNWPCTSRCALRRPAWSRCKGDHRGRGRAAPGGHDAAWPDLRFLPRGPSAALHGLPVCGGRLGSPGNAAEPGTGRGRGTVLQDVRPSRVEVGAPAQDDPGGQGGGEPPGGDALRAGRRAAARAEDPRCHRVHLPAGHAAAGGTAATSRSRRAWR